MYQRSLKRIIDVGLATLALLFLLPVLLLTAAAIRMEDGGPALFVQERAGRNGERFRFLKFRSMPVETGDVPSAEARSIQITRVGKLIRRSNIDELPQLINIIRGDMSIVGPRPAIFSQTELLRIRERNGASACRPGLTGAAQINSYDGMPEEEKAKWDGWYAERGSAAIDCKIILRTFGYLLKPPPTY